MPSRKTPPGVRTWKVTFEGGWSYEVEAITRSEAIEKANQLNKDERWEILLNNIEYWSNKPFPWEDAG